MGFLFSRPIFPFALIWDKGTPRLRCAPSTTRAQAVATGAPPGLSCKVTDQSAGCSGTSSEQARRPHGPPQTLTPVLLTAAHFYSSFTAFSGAEAAGEWLMLSVKVREERLR